VDTAIGGIRRFVLRLVGRFLPANLRRAADLIATRPAPTPTGTVAVAPDETIANLGADLPPEERDTAIAQGREFSVETAVAMALIAIGTHRARASYAGTLTLAGATPLARTPSRS